MRYPILLLLIMVCTAARAQDSLRWEKAVPRQAIKFSPFHLLNFYSTVQVSYERRITRQFAIQAEYGHVFNNAHTFASSEDDWKYRNKKGFKAKLETRYYFFATRRGRLAWYISPELYLNRVRYDRRLTTTECFDGSCEASYRRLYTYRLTYEEAGTAFKIGFVRNDGPILWDINAGLAIRFIDYTKPAGMKEDDDNDWFEVPYEKSRTVPGFVVGFRVGYRFPWRR